MLICSHCSARYDNNITCWRCSCGSPLDYHFEEPLTFNRSDLAGRRSLRRFGDTLGLNRPDKLLSLGEGVSPLVALPWQGGTVHFKLDFMQPTGSYKDRGVACMVSRFHEDGITEVVEDSSGNAGSSLAAYCARAGITCHVFVPESTSAGKKLQISAAGAVIHPVAGSREDTTAAALEFSKGRLYGGHNWNPWFALGVRTWAFEVWEQMSWQAPDVVILPVGQGSLALGAWRAFDELHAAGHIDMLPRIYAVQAEGCAPLTQAFDRGLDEAVTIEKRPTLAEGIASAQPVRGAAVLQAVRDSGGAFVSVSDEAIARGFYKLAQLGLYVEPTSAVVAAALDVLLEHRAITADEKIVAFLSGSGLKATDHLLLMDSQYLDKEIL